LSFWRLISTSPQNQESYIPRLSRDGPTKVVVAKKQFDDKAANFLAAFPSYCDFRGGKFSPSLRIDRQIREIFPPTQK
jgi:hypothetical protein